MNYIVLIFLAVISAVTLYFIGSLLFFYEYANNKTACLILSILGWVCVRNVGVAILKMIQIATRTYYSIQEANNMLSLLIFAWLSFLFIFVWWLLVRCASYSNKKYYVKLSSDRVTLHFIGFFCEVVRPFFGDSETTKTIKLAAALVFPFFLIFLSEFVVNWFIIVFCSWISLYVAYFSFKSGYAPRE